MALGLGMTACSRDYVVGYLYATNAKAAPGLITGYEIDYQTGQLTQLADSPVPSGGNNTVTIVAAPSGKTLYVLNHDTSTVVQFAIGTDGKLYPENTYNVVQGSGVTGTFPTAATVDPAGKFLYIVFTYQNGYTTVRPGPGGIATFPINSDGSLGTALTNTTTGTALPYLPLGLNPVAVTATSANVYVLDQDGPPGTLLSFAENTSTGALTALGSTAAGTTPNAITANPAGSFLYVTDATGNLVYTYQLTGGVPSVKSTVTTGLTPDAITIDPLGLFAYVANLGASTVGTYAISSTTGALTSTGSSHSVGTGPTCVAVDPALGIYLYTSNNISDNISGMQRDPKTGALVDIQGTPFTSQMLPTCLVAVPNGAHATQLIH